MDDSTVATGRLALSNPRRWVDADQLVRRIEQAREQEPFRYESVESLPANAADLAPTEPTRTWKRRDPTPVEIPPTCRHGTFYVYNRYRCGCPPCTTIARETQRAYRERGRGSAA